ncbi:MAG: hypothetical protein K8F91_18335, partial [Candidatus Obscuribacterales bacterium]|nr:hypothetical protein [Candidatus Obscuribacterales bacterium]
LQRGKGVAQPTFPGIVNIPFWRQHGKYQDRLYEPSLAGTHKSRKAFRSLNAALKTKNRRVFEYMPTVNDTLLNYFIVELHG